MKKLIGLSLISVGFMLLTSCSKDWNCKCSVVVTDQNGGELSRISSATLINGTKGKASDDCEARNAQTLGVNWTSTTTCVLEAR